jgi:N6-adenosine-specific RNA methylase IME4
MKRYGVIIADPAWSYDRPGVTAGGVGHEYQTMTVDEIAALPVPALAAKDCILLLWGTWPRLPDAVAVLRGWGFSHVSGFPWVKIAGEPSVDLWGQLDIKPRWGIGYWVRGCSEFVLIGRRGNVSPPAGDVVGLLSENFGHSRKPDSLHEYAELLPGPYLEMFARRPRAGWDVWGNQVAGSITLPVPDAA